MPAKLLLVGALALLPTLAASQAVAHRVTDNNTGNTLISDNVARRLTVDAAGNLWAVIQKSGRTTLFSSADDGKTWKREASVATTRDASASGIAADPDCRTLHIGWYSKNGTTYDSVYYQAFDTTTRAFIGTPALLQQGIAADNGYRFQDITVTPGGTVVIAMNAMGVVTGTFTRWSGYLLVKPAGNSTFNAPVRVNQAFSGLRLDMQAIGETIHMAYRTSSGGHNATYRAYDLTNGAFVANEVWIGGPKGGDALDITNGNGITADDAGNLYVIYGIGDTTAGKGEIKVAFAKPPYTAWTTQQVAADAPMIKRANHFHLTVVHTADRQVFTVYSKAADGNTTVYSRELKDGAFVSKEASLVTTTGKYTRIWGARARQARTGQLVVALDQGNLAADLINAGGKAGHATFTGIACSGSLTTTPQIRTDRPPELGQTVTLVVEGAPANTGAVTTVGLTCLAKPIDLGLVGAPGCSLYYDSIITAAFATNGSGSGTLPLVIPALPFGGTARLQVGLLAGTANRLGIITTRGLSMHL